MSTFRATFANTLSWLFSLALGLYPAGVRHEYAGEMQAVFKLQVRDAAHKGAWALFILACREARDLPLAIGSAHFLAARGRMNFPSLSSSDQTPWPVAVLSLLPFFIAGPVRIIFMSQQGWKLEQFSQLLFLFLLLSSLVVAGSFALGILKKFPRWAYPYPVYLAFSLYVLTMNAASLFHWGITGQSSFFLYMAVILAILWLPGLRLFYSRIPQDGTLLSYGLYGIILYLLSQIEVSETQRSNLLVLVPSLISLCTALAHLRIRSAVLRIAALLVGTYIGLFFWLLPIFQGMVSIWIGFAIGMFMLAAYGTILTAIILSPLLVIYLVRSLSRSDLHPGG